LSEIPPAVDSPPPPGPPAPALLPWEEPEAGFASLFPTIGRFVVRPIESFARMSLTVDLVRPVAYYVALALFAAIVNQIWGQILWDANMRWLQSLIAAVGQGAMWQQLAPQLVRPGVLQIVLGLVLTPLIYLIALFIVTGVCHATLVLLGGGTNGFAASLRALAYTGTSSLAVVIPFVGGLLGLVWWLILGIVGLAAAHRTESWKAALAILLPLVACCLCCIAGAVAFGAAIAQAIQHAGSM
jgi:hypothetical protein